MVLSINRVSNTAENIRERTATAAKRMMERLGSDEDLEVRPLDDGY